MAADTLHQLAHSGRVASAHLTDDDVHAYGTLTPARVAEWLAEWETAIPVGVTEGDRRRDEGDKNTTWWAGMESQVAYLRSQYASLELDKNLRDQISRTFEHINSIPISRKEKGKGKAREVQVKADVSTPWKAAGSSKQTDLSDGALTPRAVDVAIAATLGQPKKKIGAGQATRPYRILLYGSVEKTAVDPRVHFRIGYM